MNVQDLDTLKMFASLTLQYLAAFEETSATGDYDCLENEVKLRKRLTRMYPLIESILNHDSNSS